MIFLKLKTSSVYSSILVHRLRLMLHLGNVEWKLAVVLVPPNKETREQIWLSLFSIEVFSYVLLLVMTVYGIAVYGTAVYVNA